jgi:hypothetical protein
MLFCAILQFSSLFLKLLKPNEDFTLKVIPLFTVLLLVTLLLVPDNHKYGDSYIYISMAFIPLCLQSYVSYSVLT